ncbi:SAM-dependent methyltransferase [Kutzneria sp. NPDC052558]|uniref:SAM-dependent methyltransferase n=1 Tax=Kutzneria sp. NPDC052558 TaxID=3364121 RepID=UPI0037CCB31E
MERPTWAPGEVDLERPSAARVYDYYLGGYHNLAVDREFAEQAMQAMPELPLIMRTNRAFLRRSVRYLVGRGIRQFLDLGSGIPTVGNVHEIAQAAAPECRVVYVDKDPVAVAHSQVMLEGNQNASVLLADMRDHESVLASDAVTGLLDLSQPVAVLMFAVLHFVDDDSHVEQTVRGYLGAVASGSYLVVSHGTHEHVGERGKQVERLYTRADNPLHPRNRAQVAGLAEGLELVEPGVVYLPSWHPDSPEEVEDHPERSSTYALVAFKP